MASNDCEKGKPPSNSEDVCESSESTVDASWNFQKICGVCGDKALGYNFGAISCESCKAFFRRNAISSKPFKCPFNNVCEITVVTRRFCQKCRLEKCFRIGMVKEHIMSEEDKANKRKKIEQNRASKRPRDVTGEDLVSSSKATKLDESLDSDGRRRYIKSSPVEYDDSSTASEPLSVQYDVLNSTTNSPTHVEYNATGRVPPVITYSSKDKVYEFNSSVLEDSEINKEDFTIKSLLTANGEGYLYSMSDNANLRKVSPSPDQYQDVPPSTSQDTADKARDILEDVERIPIEPNSIESILCEAIKLEYEACSVSQNKRSANRDLNEMERSKLNELILANKALHAPLDVDVTQFIDGSTPLKGAQDRHDPALLSIINLTAVAIRRLIKMSKKINAFRNMCEEDQVALLKGGCTEMMILRSTMNYDCTRNSWKVPFSHTGIGDIRADLLKLAKGDIYGEHDRFIRSFDKRWRTDENIILIMSAIVLFAPSRPGVVHDDVVKLEQRSYYYLLRRYLESVYPGCEAKSIFLKLIQKIMELNKLTNEVISVYVDVNPLEPLLIEIFDLKGHGP